MVKGGTKCVKSISNDITTGIKYYTTIVDGKSISVHRIVLCLRGFELEGKIVDHIDGNGLNNSIENLRIADGTVNARNTTKSKLNTTGFVGVSRNMMREVEYYIASWKEDGKLVQKRFSIKKLGEEVAYQEAVKARKNAFEALNKLGYGYTERHGTSKGH